MPDNNGGTTTLELVEYYGNLLVSQYQSKPRAVATIETSVTPIIMPGTSIQKISFMPVPTGGSFTLAYDGGSNTVTINWNDSAATIQTALRQLPPDNISGGSAITVFGQILQGGSANTPVFDDILSGGGAFGWDLSMITVTGDITPDGMLTITFIGVQPPAALFKVVSNALTGPLGPVAITITETDLTMPLAVLNGFALS